MRVFVLPDGRVDMTYFPEHWGHTGNVRLFLSKEQRHEIARLLVAGIDPNDIICEYSQDENPRLRTVDRHTIYRVSYYSIFFLMFCVLRLMCTYVWGFLD